MKKINEVELKEIFKNLKNGDSSATELLFKNYHSLIYGVSFSILKNKENSEDVTQNVFAKILKLKPEQFPTQYESSWLYTVTKNEAIQFLRNQKQIVDIDDLYSIESDTNEINDILDMEAYYKLLEGLKPIDKEIISLRILSDFTFEKIAQMLNMPIGTVEWRYYKALHCIKLSLANLSSFIIVFTVWKVYTSYTSGTDETPVKNTVTNSVSTSRNTVSNSSGLSFSDIDTNTSSPGDNTGAADSIYDLSEAFITLGFFCVSIVLITLTVIFALKKKKKIKKKH